MSDQHFDEIDNLPDDGVPEPEGQEMNEHYRFTVDKGQNPIRIDKYLSMHIVGISRTRVQQAAEANCILVNDSAVKANYKIKPRDVISVVLGYPKHEFEIVPQDIPLDILYEDDDLIVINKKAGMVVHPGFGNFEGTVANAVAYRLKDIQSFDITDLRPGIVHRIDKDTSGLMVVAKNKKAKVSLADQFFEKTTKRKYVALVWGTVKEDEGTIESYIGRNVKDRLQMAVVDSEKEGGKHAITHYKVLERIGYVSLVECVLETGRTHQIRVHMKHLGHPLFNDARYGGDQILKGQNFSKYKQFVQNCFKICPRQALHAKQLGFKHPKTGEEMFFDSKLAEDMTLLIEKWRNYIASIDNNKQLQD